MSEQPACLCVGFFPHEPVETKKSQAEIKSNLLFERIREEEKRMDSFHSLLKTIRRYFLTFF